MRAPARLFVWAVAIPLGGCCAAARPDAQVAMAVERAERRRVAFAEFTELAALASADDEELPITLPAPRVSGAKPDGADAFTVGGAGTTNLEGAAGGAEGDRLLREWSKAELHFAVVPPQPAPFLSDDSDPMRDPSAPAGRRGLPHLQISLFRFSFNGQPVGLKCSVKNKHLMLAIKFPL